MMNPRDLLVQAWCVARHRFPHLTADHFARPWRINEAVLPSRAARPQVDDVCYRAAAYWLDKLTTTGEFDDSGITAGRLRRRILQCDGVTVPRAVILAVAASKGFDIFAGEYDVWIALLVDGPVPI